VIIRTATEGDFQGCTAVWLSTQTDLGAGPIQDQPLNAHELHTGRLLVADADGEVVGFGATLTRSGVAYLADLFVTPPYQNRGIGRRLMHALLADHRGPLFTFASADPRSQGLYEQFGMRAVEPYHYLDAQVDTLVPWETDVELLTAELSAVVEIDATFTGRNRGADITYASFLGATWYLASRDSVCIGAVAVVAPVWWNPWHPQSARIGPVMAHDAADIAPIMSSAISATASLDVDVVSTFVPSSLGALPALLHAGFEVVDSDLLMSSDEALIDRHRYLPTVDTP
jgi:GNAT superfamily N-acetyltransferase